MIVKHGWRYYFTIDHPTCRRCGRPDLGTLCYCVNESVEKAAETMAGFEAQRSQLNPLIQLAHAAR